MIFEKQVVNGYKGMMHTRYDNVSLSFYFSHKDFDGFQREAYAFKSSMGHTLQGYLYYYDQFREDRLIVFDHGLGNGHRAYMKEIEKLCSHGYRVFAYDHTGCMESGGESTNGLAQSLCDLNDCLATIKADKRFAGLDISVVGHSWGAFSTLNISALHPEISHIVAMSGFVSVEEMMKMFFAGPLKGYRKAVLALERSANPKFSTFNAVESLKNSNVKALLIYSENDQLCRRKHYDILKEGLNDKENIHFLLVENKGHNPNYTEEAVKLLEVFKKARAKFAKKKNTTKEQRAQFLASFNWHKMTEQDEAVWQEIFAHLDDK
ncbi:MAG: alpha/beta fold hydrolase [Clostridia bacterium]|nr:alpha/beta fold hydrolase [Clostridia bacterium]